MTQFKPPANILGASLQQNRLGKVSDSSCQTPSPEDVSVCAKNLYKLFLISVPVTTGPGRKPGVYPEPCILLLPLIRQEWGKMAWELTEKGTDGS